MILVVVLFPLLLLAGCAAERTYVMCTTCKKEPYIAISELRFATQWGATCLNREAQPIDCAHSDYDVDVRCTAPCTAGDCELPCEKHEWEPGVVTVLPRPSELTSVYTGPLTVDVTLRKHGTDRSFQYRSPTIWYSNEGLLVVCLDRRLGALHPLVPCRYSGVSAKEPLFAIAYQRDPSLFSTETAWDWHFLDKAFVNETFFVAQKKVRVGDLDVPVFRLADIFQQFRTAGGRSLKPGHYMISIARPASESRAERSLELEVR